MKVINLLKRNTVTFSCELFPPKAEVPLTETKAMVNDIAALSPDFISVTYGAGGSNSKSTIALASDMQDAHHIPAVAHLTCVAASKQDIAGTLGLLKEHGIQNILALRGDIPAGMDKDVAFSNYKYASELISDIKKQGDFCVGGACYPEGHLACNSIAEDIVNLKRKVDSGCDFLTTQMFFDNNILYHFLYKALAAHINVPIVAGIMPVTNSKQIKRICEISGTNLPPRFRMIVEKFADNPQAMKQAGIAYATEQIIDLIANGVSAIHLYTMNRPDIAKSIMENLSHIIRA